MIAVNLQLSRSKLGSYWLGLACIFFCVETIFAQPYEVYDQRPPGIESAYVQFSEQRVHYTYSGDQTKRGLLFIHGTPGSWQAFGDYLSDRELQNEYFMVAVDRPGWGASVSKSAKPDVAEMVSFDFQARAIDAVMSRYPDKRWLILGHSLGASIAPKVALIAPEKVGGLLLLAGSQKPALGGARWYNLAASMMVIKWMLPSNLKYSNDEIMALRRELASTENKLMQTQLNADVVVIQGMKDRLVSPKNAAYAKDKWQSVFSKLRVIELPEAGHFLPWKHSELVRATIREIEY